MSQHYRSGLGIYGHGGERTNAEGAKNASMIVRRQGFLWGRRACCLTLGVVQYWKTPFTHPLRTFRVHANVECPPTSRKLADKKMMKEDIYYWRKEGDAALGRGVGKNSKVQILAKDLFVRRIYCHRKSAFPGKDREQSTHDCVPPKLPAFLILPTRATE